MHHKGCIKTNLPRTNVGMRGFYFAWDNNILLFRRKQFFYNFAEEKMYYKAR